MEPEQVRRRLRETSVPLVRVSPGISIPLASAVQELPMSKQRTLEQELLEIETLRREHGVRITAAVALVAERHGVNEATLAMAHFEWCLEAADPKDALSH